MCIWLELLNLSAGRTVDVKAFTTEAGGLNEVPIVDVIIAYDCPRTSKVFFLRGKECLVCRFNGK